MTTSLTVPVVHLNGTSRAELVDGYLTAWRAVEQALDVVQKKTMPNGRDYYPAGPDAMAKANAEHADRLKRVIAVAKELYDLAEAVQNAEGPR